MLGLGNSAWFKKGSGAVAGTGGLRPKVGRVLRTAVPDPFLNHAGNPSSQQSKIPSAVRKGEAGKAMPLDEFHTWSPGPNRTGRLPAFCLFSVWISLSLPISTVTAIPVFAVLNVLSIPLWTVMQSPVWDGSPCGSAAGRRRTDIRPLEVCVANARSGGAYPCKSGLPSRALRGLKMQASTNLRSVVPGCPGDGVGQHAEETRLAKIGRMSQGRRERAPATMISRPGYRFAVAGNGCRH